MRRKEPQPTLTAGQATRDTAQSSKCPSTSTGRERLVRCWLCWCDLWLCRLPTAMKYYDEDLQLARTMTFSDYKQLGKRYLPVKNLIVPADKPEEFTEIIYESMRYDIKLSKRQFSLQQLQRAR